MVLDNRKCAENFMLVNYLKQKKTNLQKITCPLNKNAYLVDQKKLEFLTHILQFELGVGIELKKSSIHGMGVFATHNISKNEWITCYPGDIVEYIPNADRNVPNHVTCCFQSFRFEDKHGKNGYKFNYDAYKFDLDESYSIVGCPDFKDDPNYMGHFINDGAKSNSTAKSDEIYSKITQLKSNCCFYSMKDLHVAIIATRDIQIGEELLTSYGCGYWRSYNKG